MPGLFAQETPSLADADRGARKIVSQMTLEEKVAQMHGTSDRLRHRVVVGLPRLGIPDLLITNGPAGLGPAGPGHEGKATALPAPIALAATWDLDAAREYGAVAGSESADCGNMFLESPDINIARVPQNGRTFEAYGEDPFLVSRLAVANIEGIQSQGIIANVKHFAVNNQETNRHSVNAKVDERTLREIYLPAFEASVKEAHVGSVMGAYNQVNGCFCCENAILLDQILKKEWGFDGFVSSDFMAVQNGVPSVMNGLDLEMPNGKWFGVPLEAGVKAGTVPEAVIDEHLVRRFRTMMKFGVWDHLPGHKPIPEEKNGAIARRLAEEGVVLLRNEKSLLPLSAASLKSVALIGPFAGHAMTGGGGSSKVNPLYKVAPLEGLKNRLGAGVAVTLDDGSDVSRAVAIAKAVDVAVVMIGEAQQEGHDFPIVMPDGQDDLVAAIAGANPRTIIVLKTGGPVLMPWREKVPAIIEAWYPGEEDGNVVPAILFGDYNPSGKLPITFPKSLADLPAHTTEQYPGVGPSKKTVAQYSERLEVGYRWYDAQNIEPLYPFGYGLSYTSFAYANLKLSAKTLSAAAPALTVDFDVVNAGKYTGTEVAQVYVGFPSSRGLPQPPRQLKGFARIGLHRGQSGHAHIVLDAKAFSSWDIATHGWKAVPGDYQLLVGASSRNILLKGSITLQ